MSASKTLHNSVGVPQIQRYGALSVRKSCHHHHLRPRSDASFRGFPNLNDWLQRENPQRKNPHPTKTGTDLGDVEISFWLLLWKSLQQNQRTQRFIVANMGPPRFFWLKKNNLPESTCHCCQPFGNKNTTNKSQKNKTTNNSPPKKQPTGKPSNLKPICKKKPSSNFSRRLHIPIVHLSYFPSPGRCDFPHPPSMGRFHQPPWLQRPPSRWTTQNGRFSCRKWSSYTTK